VGQPFPVLCALAGAPTGDTRSGAGQQPQGSDVQSYTDKKGSAAMNDDWKPASFAEAIVILFTVVFCVGVWWIF
jgi:hypothetical protein